MGRTPVSSGVERGVVRPSNQPGAAGSGANNSYLPLDRRAAGVNPSHYGTGGDNCGGSADLAGQATPVRLPNHHFDVSMAKMPQPPSAIELGRGAVPVTPGLPNRAIPELEILRQPRK